MGSWLKLVASPKNLPRSLITCGIGARGASLMISQFRIPPGPLEAWQPGEEENRTQDCQRDAGSGTMWRYWGLVV